MHGLEELPTGEHPPRLARHGGQQLELGRGQFNRFIVPETRMRGMSISRSPTSIRSLGIGVRAAAPKHGPDPGDKFVRAERFHHVVIGAEFEPDDAVHFVTAGGQDDHRQAASAAEVAQQVQAVAIGQPEIEHHQVGLVGPDPDGSRLRSDAVSAWYPARSR